MPDRLRESPGQERGKKSGLQGAGTEDDEVRLPDRLESRRRGVDNGRVEQSANRRARGTADDLPFPDDRAAVFESCGDLRIGIADGQQSSADPQKTSKLQDGRGEGTGAPEFCGEEKVSELDAIGETFAEEGGERVRIGREGGEAVSSIPDLGGVQGLPQEPAVSSVVGDADEPRQFDVVEGQGLQDSGLSRSTPDAHNALPRHGRSLAEEEAVFL